MKTVNVRDLQRRVKACVDDARADRVVITRRGRPAALLVGGEGDDWETVVLQTNPTFWKLIRTRRRRPTISLGELKSCLQPRHSR